jgi:hypothetical protein
VAVIQHQQLGNGDARHHDEVWVVVKRTVDGNDVRYVEQFQPLDWGDDPNYCWFVDCGLAGYSGGGGLTMWPSRTNPQELTPRKSRMRRTGGFALVAPISVTDGRTPAMTPGNHYH